VTSAYVTVTVCIPASVTAQPTATSTSIFAGQSTTLSVGTAGTSASIQWYTTGGALAGSGSSITLSPTTTTSYYAVVANSCGSATSNNISVNVTPCTAPSIASQPRSSTINSGQSATLSVTAAGTAPFTYQWYLSNGTRLSGTSSVLTVTPTATTSYYVIVTDPCGTIRSNTITITICQPPGITSEPANTTPTTIHSGQTITMTVVATGTALQYQWYQQLPTDSVPQAVIGAGSNVLTAAPTQTGTKYTVKVYNGCGSVTSKTLTITVTP
jgi:hypothetical protein